MDDIPTLKEQARAFERDGELEQALALYRRILQALDGTPAIARELALFVKVGDLELKRDEPAAAIELYERAAERYAAQGQLKAVLSLAAKVLRVVPERLAVYLRPCRSLLAAGHMDAARDLLEMYAEAADLRDTVEMLRRLHGGPPDEVRSALERIVAAQEAAHEAAAVVEPLPPEPEERAAPAAEAPAAAAPEPAVPPAGADDLVIEHTAPPPTVEDDAPPPAPASPPPGDEPFVRDLPVLDTGVDDDAPASPFEPHGLSLGAAPPEPELPAAPDAERGASAHPFFDVPVPRPPAPKPEPPRRRVEPPRPRRVAPAPASRRETSAGRRRESVRPAPPREAGARASWKFAAGVAAALIVGVGGSVAAVMVLRDGDPLRAVRDLAVPPAARPSELQRPSSRPTAPDLEPLWELPSVGAPPALSPGEGAPPARAPLRVPPADGVPTIVAVAGLSVRRVSRFTLGSVTAYYVIQLLESGDTLALTLTPVRGDAPPPPDQRAPRITALPTGALLGRVDAGGYHVNAEARVPAETLVGLLGRLEPWPRR